jgi:hypothetical protein
VAIATNPISFEGERHAVDPDCGFGGGRACGGSRVRPVGSRRGEGQGLPQLSRGGHEEDGPVLQGHRSEKGDPAALAGKLKDGKGHVKVAASDAELKAAIEYVLSQK